MFNKKKGKRMNKSAVFWFEFYSKRFGPWPYISGVTSDKDMPLKTNPPSKLFVVTFSFGRTLRHFSFLSVPNAI